MGLPYLTHSVMGGPAEPKSQKCEFSRLNSKEAKKTTETDFGQKNAVATKI